MEKKIKLILAGMMLVAIVIAITYQTNDKISFKETDIYIVSSLEDPITNNTVWCGTFNLIWNDLKEKIAKQDIIFHPQLKIVENLNQGTFTKEYLNENSYYKIVGHPTPNLKKEIEKAIKEKFNETSSILDDFSFENHNEADYFLYAMLKKEFTFPSAFTSLKKGTFKNTKNISFFGIEEGTKEKVREQVEVLYYKKEHDFAIKLKSNNEEEVILSMGQNKASFKEIYEEIKTETENFKGTKDFTKEDTLKIPVIDMKIKKEFVELENQSFYLTNGEEYYIQKALQTIEMQLDEKGGRIKSEAGMAANTMSAEIVGSKREFNVDETFTIFLKEKNKDLPYFAAKVDDITKFN